IFFGVRFSSLTGSFSNQILVRMDVKSALIAKDVKKHRSLTPVSVFRGLICLLVLLSTAFTMIIYCGFPSAIVVAFLLGKINKTKRWFCWRVCSCKGALFAYVTTDTEVRLDVFVGRFAIAKGQCHGYIKAFDENTCIWLGISHYGVHFQWEKCIKMLSTFKDPKDPSGLLFPLKGHRFHKCIRSQKYAAENGLPILKNVLLPKTKGFCACLEDLRGSLDA
ncbi:hypothetical protein CUMW_061030, partial [Citrus unshiu]